MNFITKNNRTKTFLVLLMTLFLLMNDLTIVYGVSQELKTNSEELKEIDIKNSEDDDKIVENIVNNKEEKNDEEKLIENDKENQVTEEEVIEKEDALEENIEENPKEPENNIIENNDFKYEKIDEDNIRILEYIGDDSKDIIIPEYIDGKKVKEIGDGKKSIFYNKNNIDNNIRVNAKNIVLNTASFSNLKIFGKTLEFKGDISEIKDESFKNLNASELILPEDVESVKIGKSVFQNASIDYFNIPFNLKTSDKNVYTREVTFQLANINEPINNSLKKYLGSKGDSPFRINIGKNYTNIENLGLSNVNVHDIFIPSHVESISDDAFKDINIIDNIVFYDRPNFDNINLEKILSNMNTSFLKNNINVYIPKGSLENIPSINNFTFIEYNDINYHFSGGIQDNAILPTIPNSNIENDIDLYLDYKNIFSVLSDILGVNSYSKYLNYIYPKNPSYLQNASIEISNSFTGTVSDNIIPLSISKVVLYELYEDSQSNTDYSISDYDNYFEISLNDLLNENSASICFNANHSDSVDTNDLYSFDVKIFGNVVNNNPNLNEEINIDISKKDLEYDDSYLKYNFINYHALTLDTLLSLNEEYSYLYGVDLSSLEYNDFDKDMYKNIKVFNYDKFLNDDIGSNVYTSYDFDITNTFYDENKENFDIDSKGISIVGTDTGEHVEIENLNYETINPNNLKFKSNKNEKKLKYIIIGDASIVENTKKYFNGIDIDNNSNLKVLKYDNNSLLIKDYVKEFNAVRNQMLLIYDGEEPGTTPPEEKPNPEKPTPEKPGGGGGGGKPNKPSEEKPTPEKPEEPEEPEIEIEPSLNLKDHIKYLQGYKDKTIQGDANITREEVSAIFFRLLDPEYRDYIRKYENEYHDINGNRWSNKHISTLSKGEIVEGYPDGNFKPSQSITRAEVAVIASRFDALEILEESKFNDVKGHWAEKYIDSAEKKGWIKGYEDGSFKPNQPITRGEFVTLVNNVLNRKVNKENILDNIEEFVDLNTNAWYYEAIIEASNSHDYEDHRLEDNSEIWTEITNPDIEM